MLSASSEEELNSELALAREEGVLTEYSTESLKDSEYRHQVKNLKLVPDWDVNFIEKRSERIASLAWDQLYSWLK